ncbi:MAG: hypothetical protein SAMD01599839_20190 [Rectinema sp.]
MGSEWETTTFSTGPLEIIDGDRGKNYPTQAEFQQNGYCLFLNAGNVTSGGFNFSDCVFISLDSRTELYATQVGQFSSWLFVL